MEITKMKIGDIKLAPYNPRVMPEAMMERLEKSLDKFGYIDPIVVNKRNGNAVGGNMRLKALRKKMHKDQMIDVVVVDLDDAQEKALNMALNKIVGNWDEPKISELLKSIEEGDKELLNLTGFSEQEIKDLSLFDGNMKRPEFDDLVDRFSSDKGKSEKNENWFYIEFYKKEDQFKELKKLLIPFMVGKGKHEVSGQFFFDLVKENVKDTPTKQHKESGKK